MAFRSTRSVFARFGGLLGGLSVLLLLGPALVNLAVVTWEHARHPVPGEFYEVDGARMHIDCTGAGSPTVVLESAAGASYLLWRRVQPELSQVTRVCSYDRAGHGWSAARGEPRDAESVVHELHSLLDQAGVPRPFLYVGHSAGGLYVREYAKEYPTELSGIALLEASSPRQIDELPGWRKGWEEDVVDRRRTLWKDKLRVWSGWERMVGSCRVAVSEQDQAYAGQYRAMQCRPGYVDADDSELPDFDTSSKQAAGLRDFGRIPLLIVSRDPSKDSAATPEKIAGTQVWQREQEDVRKLSPLSWRIIAKGSGHMVPLDRPELVVSQLSLLVNDVRSGAVAEAGTTSTR